MARIANEIDYTGLQQYKNVDNFIGVPNAVLSARIDYLNLGVKLDNTATPRKGKDSRVGVLSSQMQASLADTQATLFQRAQSIGEQYDTGEMGFALGWQFAMDQNVAAHTIGALGTTPLVNGANQTGSTIIADGATASVVGYFKEGDIITLGVNGVVPNTATKTGGAVSTGQLQQLVVTADVDSDGSGNLSIPVSPPIITTGAFQTVTGSPADNAAILTFGHASSFAGLTIKNGMFFHRQAFTRVSVDLPVPLGVDMGGRIKDPASGLAFRLVRAYDIRGNSRPTRVESLWGWSTLYPEWAARAVSSS